MNWLMYGALFGALALIVVHRIVAKRYLDEYVAAHGALPGWDWLRKRDENPAVERWRVRRLLVIAPLYVLFAVALLSLLTYSP